MKPEEQKPDVLLDECRRAFEEFRKLKGEWMLENQYRALEYGYDEEAEWQAFQSIYHGAYRSIPSVSSPTESDRSSGYSVGNGLDLRALTPEEEKIGDEMLADAKRLYRGGTSGYREEMVEKILAAAKSAPAAKFDNLEDYQKWQDSLGDNPRGYPVEKDPRQDCPWKCKAGDAKCLCANQREISLKIDSQEMDLLEWLKTGHPEVFEEQKHLDAGTPERAYWHYGRWSALIDARSSIKPVMVSLKNTLKRYLGPMPSLTEQVEAEATIKSVLEAARIKYVD